MSPLRAERAAAILRRARDQRILVVGDVMLDEFVWGRVSRISPEAPMPVVEVSHQTFHLGGAANVASSVRALGGTATVAGVVGQYAAGSRVREELSETGTSPTELDAVDTVLRRDHESSLAAAFSTFARWNLFTGSRAASGRSYQAAAAYPEVALTAVEGPLPKRIGGEISYLSAAYYQLPAPAGTRVRVTVERTTIPVVDRGVDQPPRCVPVRDLDFRLQALAS